VKKRCIWLQNQRVQIYNIMSIKSEKSETTIL
jgi:hypothetical protein